MVLFLKTVCWRRTSTVSCRKRLLANTQDNNEDDIADDPNIETAISIKNSLHNIMRMTKQQLQQNISNSQETVDVLRQHTVF
jgi:hypothetical protein